MLNVVLISLYYSLDTDGYKGTRLLLYSKCLNPAGPLALENEAQKLCYKQSSGSLCSDILDNTEVLNMRIALLMRKDSGLTDQDRCFLATTRVAPKLFLLLL